ncbi:MAG: UDP-N-acetylmuramoyl-tripeptide--D-alanyl-D-alanine ligase [Pseudomonadota bacterium]
MNWSLGDIADVLGLRTDSAAQVCTGVSIDSRTIHEGELFVAISGPNFDGTDYIEAARQSGATAALTTRQVDSSLPQLIVGDTLQALHQLAIAWRRKFAALTTIGITGSNGKTTMRSLVQALCGADTHATRGNLNNHLGVPLVVFGLGPEHRYAVIEMGANHIGEIAVLAALAKPTIGIVTNAGPAHLEGFGSLDGVAQGKGEMFEALDADSTAVINRDDRYFDYWLGRAEPAEVITFGSTSSADVWYSDYRPVDGGGQFALHHAEQTFDVRLQLEGEHNAMNCAAACAAGLAAGLEWSTFATRLASVVPVDGRLHRVSLHSDVEVIDDSYNANPASMRAAIESLVAGASQPWAVLGDMLELGDGAVEEHRALGAFCREAGVQRLFAFGTFSAALCDGFGADSEAFEDMSELNASLLKALVPDVTIGVKGSRSTRMERVVEFLREQF